MHISKARRGFTLIEVLVVIGIIAVLAAVVLVAVNPARQFKLARDSQRTANVEALLNAIHQNMSEHHGSFLCNGTLKALPSQPAYVMFNASSSDADPASPGNIAYCLVPDYLSALPFDPGSSTAHYTSLSDYNTAYQISQDPDGRITASSTGELVPTISTTR